jgi:hypothetical protein
MQSGYFERVLNWNKKESMPWQAHAVDAYSRCAVLVAAEQSIFCTGFDDLELWCNAHFAASLCGERFWAPGQVDDEPAFFFYLLRMTTKAGVWPKCCWREESDERCVCVFITAGPSTKLFTWGGGGHVLRETTSRGLCGRRAEACVD